jgi:polyhydroxyalkanoate synthase subunit PhaC
VIRARRKHTAADGADLLARCIDLQHRLASYWAEIGGAAAQDFARCLRGMPRVSGSFESVRALHALWVDCAEQARAGVIRGKGFCGLQADLINTLSAMRAAGVHLPRELGSADFWHVARSAAGDSAGCSRKQLVWSEDKVALHRYQGIARAAPVRPLLICFALVNRPYVLDLQPDRSFVRKLLSAGLDVYLIDWGYADSGDRALGLHDYIEGYLRSCVRHILREHATDSLNLIGICQGGTFSLCYTALHPQQIHTLTTIATAVDFQTPADLLSKWSRGLDARLLARAGNAPGEWMNALYLSLAPLRLTQHKYFELLERADDAQYVEHFMRMENWLRDCPDQAATALSQFVKWFYQENRLIHGTLRLGRRKVNLANIVQPVLNIYATRDHIVPARAATPLRRMIGSSDYTAFASDTGHIGIFASRRGAEEIPQRIAEWLRTRNL